MITGIVVGLAAAALLIAASIRDSRQQTDSTRTDLGDQ